MQLSSAELQSQLIQAQLSSDTRLARRAGAVVRMNETDLSLPSKCKSAARNRLMELSPGPALTNARLAGCRPSDHRAARRPSLVRRPAVRLLIEGRVRVGWLRPHDPVRLSEVIRALPGPRIHELYTYLHDTGEPIEVVAGKLT